MIKTTAALGLSLVIAFSAAAQLRPCASDENRALLIQKYPGIRTVEADLEKEISERIAANNMGQYLSKGAGLADSVYHVPVVFHVVHDYGEEDVTDDQIFEIVSDMNRMYSRSNPDSNVVAPYAGNIPGTSIQYRGKANIVFHLATKDPNGNPTRGITRTRSYFANNAGDDAKILQWPPNQYVNIWLVHTFSGTNSGAAAYAYQPASAQNYPWGDGIISIVQASTGNPVNNSHGISHEMGHVFSLAHPWGNTNQPQVACGDDAVDDTPPTKGHSSPTGCVAANLYDVACATGYTKTYTAAQSLALYGDNTHLSVNYPDTVNSENVMDYTFCAKMFTYGQVLRMRAALTSGVAGRSNLIAAQNLVNTGVMNTNGTFNALPSLAPVADFYPATTVAINPAIGAYSYTFKPFTCADGASVVNFKNYSYQDTIASSVWTFGNGANTPVVNTYDAPGLRFTVPGWVHASLTVTGNNGSGSNTITKDSVVYAADATGTNPVGYYMSFKPNAEVLKWPVFNYFNGTHKWETVNTAGYDDNNSIRFTNKDPRTSFNPAAQTETPNGTYSDFYSTGFDLTNSSPDVNLSFAYAGAYRTGTLSAKNDKLEISYSVTCGNSWNSLATISGDALGNNGYIANDFTPISAGQWKWFGVPIPSFIPGGGFDKIFFKFRFTVGTNNISDLLGTGNNFYMDMIGVNDYALGVTTAKLDADGIVLSPNPTSGAATITIKGGDNTAAIVHVTDVTGKLVYSTDARLNATATKVEIPADRIAVKGIYMVQVITNGKMLTQKLSVY